MQCPFLGVSVKRDSTVLNVFVRELLQPVEIKIQVGELNFRAILLFLKYCFVKDSKATISIIN